VKRVITIAKSVITMMPETGDHDGAERVITME
jgi:hypothetical protein